MENHISTSEYALVGFWVGVMFLAVASALVYTLYGIIKRWIKGEKILQ